MIGNAKLKTCKKILEIFYKLEIWHISVAIDKKNPNQTKTEQNPISNRI